MKEGYKVYEIHWKGGDVEEIEGVSVSDAFRRAGYGAGALSAVYYTRDITKYKIMEK